MKTNTRLVTCLAARNYVDITLREKIALRNTLHIPASATCRRLHDMQLYDKWRGRCYNGRYRKRAGLIT